jgi:3'-phosphoadenosine 5'-phosphosulfate (PAPS) 3'-phosphatase
MDGVDGCLQLQDLLTECYRLCQQACGIIRHVQLQREKGAGSHAGLQAELKDPLDPRSYMTVADTRAQRHIVAGLRARFGEMLDIVGEEEDHEDPAQAICGVSEACNELDPTYSIPKELQELVFGDVCVFIDPLDGTREFVEGRLQAVQCLLGIAYRGRAVAGVIGLPFLRTSREPEQGALEPCTCISSIPHVLYGVVGSPSGVAGLPLPQNDPGQHENASTGTGGEAQAGVTLAISSDLGKGSAAEAVPKAIFGSGETPDRWEDRAQLLRAGGCGFKILKVMNGQADAAVMNMKTSLWDTCAPEALVRAAGGTLTTLLGWPIQHRSLQHRAAPTGSAATGYGNRFGVVVTGKLFAARSGLSHQSLCKRVASDPLVADLLEPDRANVLKGSAVPAKTRKQTTIMNGGTRAARRPQAVDVARTIWGDPLTTAYLEDAVFTERKDAPLGVERLPEIAKYWAPEEDAVRYKQSHACRIRWEFVGEEDGVGKGAGAAGSSGEGCVRSAFYKRIVLRELPYAVKKQVLACNTCFCNIKDSSLFLFLCPPLPSPPPLPPHKQALSERCHNFC